MKYFKILLLLGKFEVSLCFSVLVDCWHFLKNANLCMREQELGGKKSSYPKCLHLTGRDLYAVIDFSKYKVLELFFFSEFT